MKGLVWGVGINDADYKVKIQDSWYENGKQKFKLVWVCPFYSKWKSMLERVYSQKFKEKYPSYRECSVCEEWVTFSNFKAWMQQQDWEGKHLDKDILYPGNKLYSTDTCVFVDPKVNIFLVDRQRGRGKYMIGVCWHVLENKFQAQCQGLSKKNKFLGYFDTELEAHKAWLACKLELAKQLAAEQTDPRVAKALIERYENYEA